jgi:F-type H+-transporting ATPase subunit c
MKAVTTRTPARRITNSDTLPPGACFACARRKSNKTASHHHMNLPLAEIYGNITSAFGLLGAAIGVGLIGFKAAEAVGRNPGASGKVLVQAIIGMALAEGLGILALFLATK